MRRWWRRQRLWWWCWRRRWRLQKSNNIHAEKHVAYENGYIKRKTAKKKIVGTKKECEADWAEINSTFSAHALFLLAMNVDWYTLYWMCMGKCLQYIYSHSEKKRGKKWILSGSWSSSNRTTNMYTYKTHTYNIHPDGQRPHMMLFSDCTLIVF